MAGYAVVDADDDFGGDVARTGKAVAANGLEFQNFLSVDEPHDTASGRASPSNRTDNQPATAPYSPFSITYYQHYFNITTSQLVHRLVSSLIPRPRFLASVCDGEVDLYGPFWTLTTLILTIYLSTSLSASISSALTPTTPTKDDKSPSHGQDFTLLSVAISLIYTYGLAFPAIIWATAKWFARAGGAGNDGLLGGGSGGSAGGDSGRPAEGETGGVSGWRLVDALAVWGYSMVVFVPVSILCVIPIPILRWILVGGATISSGYFLWLNVYPILAGTDNKNLRLLTIIIVLVHCAVGLTMKVVFFSYSVGGKLIGPDDPLSGSVGGGLGGGNTNVDGVLDPL